MAARQPQGADVGRVIRLGVKLLTAAVTVAGLWVAAYRFIDPPATFVIVGQAGEVAHQPVPLAEISPHLIRAVMAGEDARFCDHHGFDFEEIEKALAAGAVRGASTISQQTARNVFLWRGGGWFRKGLEAGFTVLIEAIWPKSRIIEVYLNHAEFAPGVFGAEAGARHHYSVSAARLGPDRAARMAAVLPNPAQRRPQTQDRTSRRIAAGAATLAAEGRDACALPG